MKVKIKRIDKSLPLPEFQTEGAVAFDLYSRENLSIEPREVARIPTNLIIEVPEKYALILKDRSSTAKKKNLLMAGGVIDQDYCGPTDEILFQVINFGKKIVQVKKGERIGQALLIKIAKPIWQEVEEIKDTSRGGFGSTD